MPGSLSPYGTNPFGARVTPLDFSHADAPTIQTYHGLTIVVEGAVVGRITDWTPQPFSRDVAVMKELNYATFGLPVEAIPGGSTANTFSFSAAEIWGAEIEIRLGYTSVWTTLMDQTRPFTLYEYRLRGDDIYRCWVYRGCWFTEKNEQGMSSEGDAIIKIDGSVTYVSRLRVI